MSRKLAVLLAVVLTLGACTSPTAGLRLTIATGFSSGVYFTLGTALAQEWAARTGIETPQVLQTQGSRENLDKLRSGEANVAISAADVASDEVNKPGKHSPRALARIYDDYLHVVVRNKSDIHGVRDLAGKRVGVGAPNSGVKVIADWVLQAANVIPAAKETLNLQQSREQLQSEQIDAFFWSGGLPTKEIVQLAKELPLRLLDMNDVMPQIRKGHDYYSAAAVPVTTYKLTNTTPVTTLTVPNLLLVTDELSAPAVKVLTNGFFDAQEKLAAVTTAANSIDIRSAIETLPVPLHQGALEYYRDLKT